MTQRTGLFLSAMALACLLPGRALFADHVASKRARSAADASAVEARLVELGASARDAADQAAALTPSELSFFAADPARVQVVGGLLLEEFMMGGGFLMMCVGALAGMVVSAKGI